MIERDSENNENIDKLHNGAKGSSSDESSIESNVSNNVSVASMKQSVDEEERHDAAKELGSGDKVTDDIFAEGDYRLVPRIPEQYRASDVIGKRVQASTASTGIPIGAIKNKAKLNTIWAGLSDTEKYILLMISEHRHMTLEQLSVLIVYPSLIKKSNQKKKSDDEAPKKKQRDALKTYFEWVTVQKYEAKLSYSATFMTTTKRGLQRKVDGLVSDGLIARISPAYSVDDRDISDRYKETPSLFTLHYYLTPLGAKVLLCCTDIRRPISKLKPIGYVPTYKSAAYQSILHEAECTEILCSFASCAMYASNTCDNKNYGLFDVCRFYHEKDVEEKNVRYKKRKIDFKSDGKFVLYVEELANFIDFYIEYDSGSSTADKIRHKTEAFIKYIFWKKSQLGEKFRSPVLLLVTQKPADLFPQLYHRTRTTYTTGIKQMSHEYFPEYLSQLNDIARVLIADCGSIRRFGTMGAGWHRVDLVSGIAEIKSYDLLTAATLRDPINVEQTKAADKPHTEKKRTGKNRRGKRAGSQKARYAAKADEEREKQQHNDTKSNTTPAKYKNRLGQHQSAGTTVNC